MLDIKTICLRGHTSENGPDGEIILEIETRDGEFLELGREKLPSVISHCWNLDSIDPKKLKKSDIADA